MLNPIKFKKDSKEPTYFLSDEEGITDEYFINEIIGIDEFKYEDWLGIERGKITNETNI